MASSTGLSPSPKTLSFVASIKDRLYLWGGNGGAEPNTVHIHSVNTETWIREFTKGPHPPVALRDGGCSLAGQHIYLYGGIYGSSYSGSLYQMNTDNWSWSELSNCSAGGPGRKSGCRMITYKDQLVVVGGYYGNKKPDSKQPGSRYERGFTNELHSYSLTTASWSSPSVKGSRPPPCANFSLTMIDEEHAVMFGGWSPGSGMSADVYILHLPTMTWTHLPHKDGDPRPKGRYYHIAVCLGYGGQHKKVLVSGGLSGGTVLSDTWLLDPQSGRWEEVQVTNKKLVRRHGHSAAPLAITPECVKVIMFGGKRKLNGSNIADTTALRFELQDIPSGRKSWVLTDIANETQLADKSESFSTRNEESVDEKVGKLQQQLEEMEIRAVESEKRSKEAERRAEESDRRVEEMKADQERSAEVLQRSTVDLQADNSKTGGDVFDKQGFISVGEATTVYTGKAMDIKYDEYGIEMHLEGQDLPPDVTEYPVAVSVAISGEFDLPGSSELVSGVYNIESSFVPQKPVSITMQHCAADNSIDNLSFASSTDTVPPFVYKCIDGGKFTSTHGEIEIDQFCYYTILYKHGEDGLLSLYQKKYQVSLHCSKNPMIEKPSRLSWSLFFTMVKNCTIFQRSVDRYFLESDNTVERLTDVVVKFDKDAQDIVLALEGDRVEMQHGWSVISLVTCSVKKYEIDNYADGRPPQFRLILMQNNDDNPQDLLHKFVLKGVDDPECFINLFKPVASCKAYIMGPSRETHYGRYFDKIKESKRSTLLKNIDDDGHLRQIAEVLQNWEQKYDLLCLSFNPDVNDICSGKYKDSPVLQRIEALHLWRRKSLEPTYDNLLKICVQSGFRESAEEIVSIINES